MSVLEVWWALGRRKRGFGNGYLSMCKEKLQAGQYFWMVNVKASKAL